MSKNRSIWTSVLSIMLALVVMAGLAVTAFAEIVTDPDELEAVLDGTKERAEGVDYDADGNGIVEMDDLRYLNGTLTDEGDLLDLLKKEIKDGLQSLIVRGDSTRALALDAKDGQKSTLLVFEEAQDFGGAEKLLIDTLWTNGTGSFQVSFLSGDKETAPVTVSVTDPGWCTLEISLKSLDGILLKNVTGIRITLDAPLTVYFDNFRLDGILNRLVVSFAGTDETILAVTGEPYGELPTPAAREFYNFVGWTLEDGTEVTKDTSVTKVTDHTLYAKWEVVPDPNPVVVEYNNTYNPYNAKNSVDILDGKHVYTYTTRDVEIPTNSPYGRRLNISVPADITHVAIEFRFTEAFQADGKTAIAPSLGVYKDASSGLGMLIYDENGAVVASGNAETGLTVGKWYTVVVTNDGVTEFGLWTAHNYKTDAAILTMEIRERSAFGEFTNAVGPFVHYSERNWGDFYRAGEDAWRWTNKQVNGNHPALYQRSIELHNPLDTPAVLKANITFKYCTDVSGNPIAPNMYAADGSTISAQSSEFIVIDPDTGKIASALECNKTYTIYVMADANANAYLKVCHGVASGVQTAVEISGCEALAYTAPAVKMAANATDYGNMGLYKSGDEWIYGYAHSTGVHTASTDYRKIQIYLDDTCYKSISFKFMYEQATNNGNFIAALNLPAGAVVTNEAGQTVSVNTIAADTWYTVTISATAGSALPTNMQIYPMGGGYSGSADAPTHIKMVVKDLNAVKLATVNVNFDLDYKGAINDLETITVTEGSAYGDKLPTPAAREFYNFVGWTLEDGTEVTKDTPVTRVTDHTLYAKWELVPDPNPVVVKDNADYNPDNAKLSCDVVNGEYIYTYTTRDVAVPTNSPYGRRLNISVPADITHVAIEFRFTEAFQADGKTAIAPGLGVYKNASSGLGMLIYDESGAVVASGNAATGLTVGKWYTVLVTNSGVTGFDLWPAHNYKTDAAILTMEIRERSAFGEFTNAVGPFVHYNERNWGDLYRTGEDSWQWKNKMVNGNHPGFSQRSIELRNPLDTPAVLKANITFKYCTDASGNPIAPNIYAVDGSTISAQSSEFIVIDPDTGKIVSALECNKTYTIYVMADANAIAYLKVCRGAASGVQTAVEISGCEALPYTASAVKMAANATDYGNMGLYKSGDEWIYGYAHSTGIHTASTDYRKIQVYLGGTTYTTLQFKCKYQESTNNGEHISAVNLSTGTLTITDSEGKTVDKGSLVADTWYTWTITAASGSTLPNNLQIYTMGWSIAGSAESPIHIKMAIKDLQVS